jgi:1-acyl-sn-glycerol-3-phosphate acyltransferase
VERLTVSEHVWISCPRCHRGNLRIRAEFLGHRVRCKHCGHKFRAVDETVWAGSPGQSAGEEAAVLGGARAPTSEATELRRQFDAELEQLRAELRALRAQAEEVELLRKEFRQGSARDHRPRRRAARPPGPVTRFLERRAFALMMFVLRRKLVTHMRAFKGLGNLPRTGPAILVANHQSYFDSFAIVGLTWLLLGRRVWVPTKVKAFQGWPRGLLHRAWGCIPIDQGQPDEAYEAIAHLLDRGEVVLLFPEGKRSESDEMLPFRFGAFNLAARRGVPIVPVGLRDSARVIPKGRLWFSRGATASLAVGKPLDPAEFAAGPDDDPRGTARRLHDQARGFISQVVAAEEARLFDDKALKRETEWIDTVVERLLDRGVEQITTSQARRGLMLTDLARRSEPDHLRFRVQYTRVYGFWLRSVPRLVAALFLPAYRRLVREGLALDPHEPYLNYCLGQFHLQVPRLLGGGARGAVDALEKSYANARTYGADPARFAVGFATALAASGRRDDAIGVLARHFSTVLAEESSRLRRRRGRALELIGRLMGALTAGGTGESDVVPPGRVASNEFLI